VCVTCGEHFTRKTSSKRHNLNIHKGSGKTVPYIQYLAGTNSGIYQVLHPSRHHAGGSNGGLGVCLRADLNVVREMRHRPASSSREYTPIMANDDGGGAIAADRESMGFSSHRSHLQEQERQVQCQYQYQHQQQQPFSTISSPPEVDEDYEPSEVDRVDNEDYDYNEPLLLATSSVSQQAPPTTTTTTPPTPMTPSTTMDGTMTAAAMNDWGTLSSETISKIAELRRLAYQYGLFSEPEIIVRCATHFALSGDNSILEEKLEQLRTFRNSMRYTRTVSYR
jgi:hypothetical protein